MHVLRSGVSLLAVGLLLTASHASTPAGERPRVEELPSGDGTGFALGISRSGLVVGLTAPGRAVVWRRGVLDGLPAPHDREFSYAGRAINCTGVAVGDRTDGVSRTRAVVWRGGAPEVLKAPAGADSFAASISRQGTIAGCVLPVDGPWMYPAIWKAGRLRRLSILPYTVGTATGINDRDEVVGYALDRAENGYAFVWRQGKLGWLESLAGGSDQAHAINARGDVAGEAYDANDRLRAVVWHRGRVRALPSEGLDASANALDEHGRIVGWTRGTEGPRRAALWERGRLRYLDQLADASLWDSLDEATGINARGEIVGCGHRTGVGPRAFILRLP
jgi:uncharacterized membrane protein